MVSHARSLLTLLDRRILAIFFLGISSGLPFLLTLSTLSFWLTQSGVSKTAIGMFVVVTIPYTFKFLWGPLVDRFSLPILGKIFGKRRSWALLAQVFLILSLVGLGDTDPQNHLFLTALMAFLVAISSACQDIVVEAYRIEIIDEDQYGVAASATYLGYRIGMLISGYGALYLSSFLSWSDVYSIMALFVVLGMITICLAPRTRIMVDSASPHPLLRQEITNASPLPSRFFKWLKVMFLPPLRELLQTYDWRVVLAFIFFYKVGDTVLNVMTTPFLIEVGYSTLEIANVAKLFGISAMIVGGFLGGLFLTRFGILASLILCAALQILSSLMFLIQALTGYNLGVLTITIGVENLTCGLGASAYIAYLSSMCSAPNTATHFALLSSFGSLARIVLSMLAGWLADHMSWPQFYLTTAFACMPCMILLAHSARHFTPLSTPHEPSFSRR